MGHDKSGYTGPGPGGMNYGKPRYGMQKHPQSIGLDVVRCAGYSEILRLGRDAMRRKVRYGLVGWDVKWNVSFGCLGCGRKWDVACWAWVGNGMWFIWEGGEKWNVAWWGGVEWNAD